MSKKDETIDAEVIEEGAVILSPFKDLDLSGGVDLGELMKTYAEVPEIDPEADNAGEQYQYVLKGHKAFVTARNKIEKVRKILVAPALAFNKDVNQRAKDLAYSISAKELELFKQRKLVEDNEQRKQDEAEKLERDRQMGIHNFIESIKNLPMLAIGTKVGTIEDIMQSATKPTEETCEERFGEAMIEWDKASDMLNTMLVQAQAVENADKIEAEAQAKRDAEQAEAHKAQAKEKDRLREEREAFEREKAEFAEAKALREAEANAEAKEKAEIEESAKAVAETMLAIDLAKDRTDDEFYVAYGDGGIDAVLKALYDNKFTHVRWEV